MRVPLREGFIEELRHCWFHNTSLLCTSI